MLADLSLKAAGDNGRLRDRHPFIEGAAKFDSGITELIVTLVCRFEFGSEDVQ